MAPQQDSTDYRRPMGVIPPEIRSVVFIVQGETYIADYRVTDADVVDVYREDAPEHSVNSDWYPWVWSAAREAAEKAS